MNIYYRHFQFISSTIQYFFLGLNLEEVINRILVILIHHYVKTSYNLVLITILKS